MVNDGISRFNRTLNKMMGKGLESATKHGRAIISTQLDPVAKGIQELLNNKSNKSEMLPLQILFTLFLTRGYSPCANPAREFPKKLIVIKLVFFIL